MRPDSTLDWLVQSLHHVYAAAGKTKQDSAAWRREAGGDASADALDALDEALAAIDRLWDPMAEAELAAQQAANEIRRTT